MAGKPAARITETSVHGGKVVSGSPNVIICKLLASRQGDAHVCPIPGHGPGKIVGCSATVLINKRGAARMGDFIACATPACPPPAGTNPSATEYTPTAADDTTKGMPIRGAEDVLKKKAAGYDVKGDDSYVKALYAEAKLSDSDKDGQRDTASAGIGLASIAGRAQQKDGNLGASGAIDVMTLQGSAMARGTENGGAVAANAKATYTNAQGSVFVGPKGDNGKNPYAEVGARGTLGVAEAGTEAFIGDDGKRVGFGVGAKASASLLDGEVTGRTAIPVGKGNTIDAKVGVSSGIGGVGGEAGFAIYKDKETGRYHFKGGVALEILGKLGFSWDISFGKKYKQDAPEGGPAASAEDAKGKDPGGGSGGTPAPGPNAIALGCSTVFIGG